MGVGKLHDKVYILTAEAWGLREGIELLFLQDFSIFALRAIILWLSTLLEKFGRCRGKLTTLLLMQRWTIGDSRRSRLSILSTRRIKLRISWLTKAKRFGLLIASLNFRILCPSLSSERMLQLGPTLWANLVFVSFKKKGFKLDQRNSSTQIINHLI